MPKLKHRTRRALVEERQAQILSAATRVFAQKGFERATIKDVAREAGLAEGSIYNYFKNKSDLLVSLPRQFVQPAVENLGAEMTPSTPGAPPLPAAVLTTIARTLVTTIRQNAHVMRILLSALPTMKPAVREKYLQTVVVYATGVLEAYLQEQAKRGVLRRDLDPVMVTRAFIGMFFPFIMLQDILQVGSGEQFDYEELIPAVVQLFLHGALAAPPQRKPK